MDPIRLGKSPIYRVHTHEMYGTTNRERFAARFRLNVNGASVNPFLGFCGRQDWKWNVGGNGKLQFLNPSDPSKHIHKYIYIYTYTPENTGIGR